MNRKNAANCSGVTDGSIPGNRSASLGAGGGEGGGGSTGGGAGTVVVVIVVVVEVVVVGSGPACAAAAEPRRPSNADVAMTVPKTRRSRLMIASRY
jgi:predicted metalloprotease